MSDEVVIAAAARTPIGTFSGKLSSLPATELGAQVIKAVLERSGIQPDQVDEVILGHVLTAGCGQNPARQAAINGGLPVDVPAMTINKVCGSGLKSVQLAVQAIRCGDAELILAGGQESMSQAPHLLPHSRSGQRMGDWSAKDSMIVDGLWDAFNDYHMGRTAENVAEKYAISREAQDAFAAQSQQRAEQAQKSGRFKDEIVPVTVPQRKGDPMVVDTDEFPRHGTTAEGLSKLRPAFQKDGSVTAGNSSGINDGAAILVVCTRAKAESLGLQVLAAVKAYSNAAIEPAIMGVAPIYAARRCLERAGWDSEDLDLIELNEAFASQSLAVVKELNWNTDKINVNGGAIALGHPIGGSGARILVTLLHEMRRRDAKRGLATLCIGGGQSVAVAVER